MDVLLLSRLQFAFTIMFHYLFPPLTIGLSVVIVFLLYKSWRTERAIYDVAARFWTNMFALNFAIGVATGIVMEFEFGTNWAVYSRYVGDVFGSALAAEGIFAFFLESGFLAILVFGWDKVTRGFHFFSGCMVSLGSIFSSIWITVANSWQQTPAGFELRETHINGHIFQRAEIVDFWAMVFNPSTIHRLVHVWLGAFILGAFFVMSISAWYLLKNRHQEFARKSFGGALGLATVVSVLQLFSGHLQADNVAEHQPAKLAAFEGLYQTEPGTGLYVFGWPDDASGEVKFGLEIPGLLALLIEGDPKAAIPGLDQLEADYGRPPVWLTFQAYHIMVAIGFLFIAATLYSCWLAWRGRLYETRWLLWFYVFAVILAFVANEMGWVAAEVGRQPWIVYPTEGPNGVLQGGLRTSEGLSEAVRAEHVLASIVMFMAVYALLFALWVFLLNHKIQTGPKEAPSEPSSNGREQLFQAAARDRLTAD